MTLPAFVALFRAINVGGHAKVSMADLKAMAINLGLAEPRTLLQSGNLIFRAARSADDLALCLEASAAEHLGVKTAVLVRSVEDWRTIIADNPFADMARADPAHLVAMPLKGAPTATAEAALRSHIKGNERVAVIGRTAYLAYPEGIGRSKLTTSLIERHLGTCGTGRNWTTVARIAAMLAC